MNYKIDKIDLKILYLLQKNAKIKIKEIAKKLNLTNTPIFNRIKKLEKEGVILGYSTAISKQKVGLGLLAFCSVNLDKHTEKNINQFENLAKNLEEVVECYHIAGDVDFLLKVVTKDIDTYQSFVSKKLVSIDNIRTVKSAFVINSIVSSSILPF